MLTVCDCEFSFLFVLNSWLSCVHLMPSRNVTLSSKKFDLWEYCLGKTKIIKNHHPDFFLLETDILTVEHCPWNSTDNSLFYVKSQIKQEESKRPKNLFLMFLLTEMIVEVLPQIPNLVFWSFKETKALKCDVVKLFTLNQYWKSWSQQNNEKDVEDNKFKKKFNWDIFSDKKVFKTSQNWDVIK